MHFTETGNCNGNKNRVTTTRHGKTNMRRKIGLSPGCKSFLDGTTADHNKDRCESACYLTPNRLPTVTLVGHTINSSIQCVAMHGLWSDLDADRASDPTPNDTLALHGQRRLSRVFSHQTRQRNLAISNVVVDAVGEQILTGLIYFHSLDSRARHSYPNPWRG